MLRRSERRFLAYSTVTSDPGVATAVAAGNAVTVEGVAPGSASVTVTATDVGGLQAEVRFQVMVPNRAPLAVGVISSLELAVGDSAVVDVSGQFSDPDGQGLSYAATLSDTSVARVSGAGSVFTVTAWAKGLANVTVTATDPGGLEATQSFAVTVPNRAPEPVGSMPARTVEVGETVTHEVASYFRDPDGDPLVYAATASDTTVIGVAVSNGAVAISAMAKGEATVTVTATDTEGLAATQALTVTVPNRAPVAGDPIRPRTLAVGDAATLDVSAHFSDPDGDPLNFAAATSNPTVARVEVSDAVLTVTASAKGGTTVTVTASDGDGLAATRAFTVSVSNQPPVASGAIEAWTLAAGDAATLELSPYFRDPDGDALSFAADVSDTTVIALSVSGATLTFAASVKGIATVTVTATDTDGLSATQAFTVTVPNRTPLVVGAFESLRLGGGGVARLDPAPGFADPDGDSLAFEATSSDLDVARAWVSLGQVLVRALGQGTATIAVVGRDSAWTGTT